MKQLKILSSRPDGKPADKQVPVSKSGLSDCCICEVKSAAFSIHSFVSHYLKVFSALEFTSHFSLLLAHTSSTTNAFVPSF